MTFKYINGCLRYPSQIFQSRFCSHFLRTRAPFGNWHYIQIEQTTSIAMKWVPGIVWDIENPDSPDVQDFKQTYF